MEAAKLDKSLTKNDAVRKRADALGGGLLFTWIGIAILAHLGPGTGLLGVGIIILGVQTIRSLSGLKREGFWVVAGLFCLLGGAWELFQIRIDFMSIFCLIAGIALLGSALAARVKPQTGGQAHIV